jgi:xylan 1,4-beta-xylosidase
MSYSNPVIPGFHSDPSVCRVGQDYYLVNSSFSYFPGVPIFHSRDLVSWRQIGHVLDRPEQLPLRDKPTSIFGGVWAPTIRYHDGRFYMVTTNSQKNILVHTDDPAGPWSDPIDLNHGGWDNSLFFDDDGTCYYHFSGGGFESAVSQVILNPETGEFLSEVRPLTSGTGESGAEGAHVYKFGDWYYLMLAEGGTHMGHMLTIQRSRSPWGPWETQPNGPMLTHRNTEMFQVIKALGHGELIQAHDGSFWVFALGFRTTGWICFASHVLGRETFLAPVAFDHGWPVVNGGEEVQLEMDVPTLPLHPWPERPTREDFEGESLGHEWVFRRNPLPDSWSMTERESCLTLYGKAGALDSMENLMVARRPEDLYYTAKLEMDFAPTREGEEAGFAAFMDEHYHTALGVRLGPDGPEVFMRRHVGSELNVVVAKATIESGPVVLKIRAIPRWYRFGFEQNGRTKWLGWAEGHLHSTEVTYGWTGVMHALWASGNGKDSDAAAHFDWYEYEADADQSFEPNIPERFDLVPPKTD